MGGCLSSAIHRSTRVRQGRGKISELEAYTTSYYHKQRFDSALLIPSFIALKTIYSDCSDEEATRECNVWALSKRGQSVI
jgi:hypothetical protein